MENCRGGSLSRDSGDMWPALVFQAEGPDVTAVAARATDSRFFAGNETLLQNVRTR